MSRQWRPCAKHYVILECVQRHFSHWGALRKTVEIVSAQKEPAKRERSRGQGFGSCGWLVGKQPRPKLTFLPDCRRLSYSIVYFSLTGCFYCMRMWSPHRMDNLTSFEEISGPRKVCILLWRLVSKISVTQPLSRFPSVSCSRCKFMQRSQTFILCIIFFSLAVCASGCPLSLICWFFSCELTVTE